MVHQNFKNAFLYAFLTPATIIALSGCNLNIGKTSITEFTSNDDRVKPKSSSTPKPATPTPVPATPTPAANPVSLNTPTLEASGNRIRLTVSLNGQPSSSQPITGFKIERAFNDGAYSVVQTNFKPSQFFPYAEYYDDLLPSGAYRYRVSLLSLGTVIATTTGSVTLSGRVFYISPGGSDGTGQGLSPSSPLKTLAYFADHFKLAAGDMIRFEGGVTHNLPEKFLIATWSNVYGNGTATNPIVFTSYNSGVAELKCEKCERVFEIRDMSHVQFTHLKFSGSVNGLVAIISSLASFQGVRFFHVETDGATSTPGSPNIVFDSTQATVLGPAPTQTHFIDDVEVAFSSIRNAGNGTGNSDGIRVEVVRSKAHIHHNAFYGNSGESIDVSGGLNHVIEYNTIDCAGATNAGGSKAHGQYYPLANVIYRFNLIRRCMTFGLALEDSKNGQVVHNTIDNGVQGYGAILLSGKNRPQEILGNVIKNNIFIGSGTGEAPIRIVFRDYATDLKGAFSNEVIQQIPYAWEVNGAFDFNSNIIFTSGYKWRVKFSNASDTGESLQTFPDGVDGKQVPVTIDATDWNSRWISRHSKDLWGMPSFTSSQNGNYSLTGSSIGNQDGELIVNIPFEDLAGHILYSKQVSRGAFSY